MAYEHGHRQRVKERYLEEGLENMTNYQVLELLLFYCIPRVDTKPIAHRLIDTFGSLSGVLEASTDELQKVEGIGPNAAVFLNMLHGVTRYEKKENAKTNKPLKTTDDFAAILAPQFLGRRHEMAYLLCLNAKGKKICCRMVSEGSANATEMSVRRIVELALAVNASAVVLAHNHPDGVVTPSQEDMRTTSRVLQALSGVGVVLLDHLIITDEEYISLSATGAFRFSGGKY